MDDDEGGLRQDLLACLPDRSSFWPLVSSLSLSCVCKAESECTACARLSSLASLRRPNFGRTEGES